MATKQTPAPAKPVQTPQSAPGTAVAVAGKGAVLVPLSELSGAVALPAEFAAELEKDAKDAAAVERPTISRISLKGGIISYEGQDMPDNKLPCVILSMVYERTFYTEKYDPNQVVSPSCFSLQETEDNMAPHDVVVKKEHATCLGCPRNEWESDLWGGRGKACKERRRLVLLPISALTSPEDVKKAELALLSLPVMSVKNYSSFVNIMSGTLKLPPYGVVTEIGVKPDKKSQFVVTFTPQSVIADVSIIRAIQEKREEGVRVGLLPFDPKTEQEGDPDEGKPEPAPAKKQKF